MKFQLYITHEHYQFPRLSIQQTLEHLAYHLSDISLKEKDLSQFLKLYYGFELYTSSLECHICVQVSEVYNYLHSYIQLKINVFQLNTEIN